MMSLADAAKLLNLSPHSLRVYVSRGAIKAIKIGNSYAIEPKEVERYRKQRLGNVGRKPRR